jgi:hypothetical protein
MKHALAHMLRKVDEAKDQIERHIKAVVNIRDVDQPRLAAISGLTSL